MKSQTLYDWVITALELEKPIGKNNQVHLSYTRGTVSATNEAKLESFQNKRVNTDNLQVILVVKDIGWNYSKVQDAINATEDL
ncbi:MAG: hypothetical protein U9N62_07435 [Thermotogota bacterium]|nr:hypothetical protein [Thermotogota bacterium]